MGAIAAFAIGMWTALGSNISNPYRSYLDTNVDNCTFPANVTAEPIPEDR